MTRTRLVTPDDVPVLTALLVANREFLAPWEPVRADSFFTVDGQKAVVRAALDLHDQGMSLPHVILDDSDEVVGRIALNGIVRGPLLSCAVGYWVSESRNGMGLACDAVHEIKRLAFERLGLHRLQAETLLHNKASQRVLTSNDFEQYGLAPAYLKIAGEWQDHLMFQVLNPSPM